MRFEKSFHLPLWILFAGVALMLESLTFMFFGWRISSCIPTLTLYPYPCILPYPCAPTLVSYPLPLYPYPCTLVPLPLYPTRYTCTPTLVSYLLPLYPYPCILPTTLVPLSLPLPLYPYPYPYPCTPTPMAGYRCTLTGVPLLA